MKTHYPHANYPYPKGWIPLRVRCGKPFSQVGDRQVLRRPTCKTCKKLGRGKKG